MKATLLILGVLLASQPVFATPSPEGAAVYIISPSQGEVVSNPVTVKFGLVGMGVAPAGMKKPNTGHHHLVVDIPGWTPSTKKQLPKGELVRHYGGGQTQTTLDLGPGKHTLQILFGDSNHTLHDKPVISERITIFVR
ncbi:MAG: DUF4399 domain-containing protein [Nitrospinota bacterium]